MFVGDVRPGDHPHIGTTAQNAADPDGHIQAADIWDAGVVSVYRCTRGWVAADLKKVWVWPEHRQDRARTAACECAYGSGYGTPRSWRSRPISARVTVPSTTSPISSNLATTSTMASSQAAS